ncbi:Protein dopey-2 [Pteropus alecto]|uniref:Protein dopey-2 n=1 Tax=Pteropus alecto TaxID=9402 RepID=L5KAZ5_PTEAL|nr:Protein dopey-2 [Pteropus alecto]
MRWKSVSGSRVSRSRCRRLGSCLPRGRPADSGQGLRRLQHTAFQAAAFAAVLSHGKGEHVWDVAAHVTRTCIFRGGTSALAGQPCPAATPATGGGAIQGQRLSLPHPPGTDFRGSAASVNPSDCLSQRDSVYSSLTDLSNLLPSCSTKSEPASGTVKNECVSLPGPELQQAALPTDVWVVPAAGWPRAPAPSALRLRMASPAGAHAQREALQSNLKYSLLPRRLIISKRLAQCLHPALPSGVHLKALETYEIIFKIVGTKWLAKDLFLYSCGLFPLLANAAMSVRPVLLGLYEKYFLPLQKLLLPSLQAFIIGLLPGLEEGSEIYDRTDALLLRLSLVVGKEVFYAALWGSVLVSPSVRLPASLFVVAHISRDLPGKEQKYMLGTDYQLTVKALCASLLDSNVLVQRNTLEIVLFFFPFYSCLDSNERAIPLLRPDIVRILSAATQTLLRRDMSLNRRLYAWLLGSDIKGKTIVPESEISNSYEDQSLYFFEKYSKDLLVEGLAELLHQELSDADAEERHHAYLRPFRILVSLLDKPEIGPQVVENLFLEVIRAFYSYCKDALGSDLQLSYTQSGNSLISTIKENRNASEIVKTVNLLITSLSTDFLWDYMMRCFEDCFRPGKPSPTAGTSSSPPPTVSELCTLLVLLLDVIPLELYSEVQTQYLPQVLGCLVQPLAEEMEALSLPELTHALKTCFKVLSKVQMPPSYLDAESTSGSPSPVKGEKSEIILDTKAVIPDDEDASFPPLKSEDSGIGLSASSPELSEHLRVPRVSPEKDDVWKKGGSMQRTFFCIQELIANFAQKNIFGVQQMASGDENKAEEPEGQRDKGRTQGPELSDPSRKNSGEAKPISVPQFKQMLSDLFTVRGSPFKTKNAVSPSPLPSSPGRRKEGDWAVDQVSPLVVTTHSAFPGRFVSALAAAGGMCTDTFCHRPYHLESLEKTF